MTQKEAASPVINFVPSPAVGESPAPNLASPDVVPTGIPVEFVRAQQERNEAGFGVYDDSQDIADHEFVASLPGERHIPTVEEYRARAEKFFSDARTMNEMYGLEPETVELYEQANNNFKDARYGEIIDDKTPDAVDLLKRAMCLDAMADDPRQPGWKNPDTESISDPILREKTRAEILRSHARNLTKLSSEIALGVGNYANIAAGELTKEHTGVDPDIDPEKAMATAVFEAAKDSRMKNLVVGNKSASDLEAEGADSIVEAIVTGNEHEDGSEFSRRLAQYAMEELAPTQEHSIIGIV